MRDISKHFGPVVANDHVDFAASWGEVHALVGENGAGKSTLMSILAGLYRPDSGEVEIDGAPVRFRSPRDAIAHGIGMVYQHFMLVEPFTVAENVILGSEGAGVRLDRAAAARRVGELAERYGLRVDPGAKVGDLPVGVQQRVEILRALYQGGRTLILDEPTALLTPQEVEELYAILDRLREGGGTIVFITHKLREVAAVSDRVTVIRRGRTVGTRQTSETTADELAELMVGREVKLRVERPPATPGEPVLTAEGLEVTGARGQAALRGVSLALRRGEIVGVCGVEGNGQAELVEAIMGMRPGASGRVLLAGQDLSRTSTRHRREAGIGYIPEDRHRHGLLLDAPLWENRVLGHQDRRPNVKGPFIDRAGARRDTQRIVDAYDVRAPGIDTVARALSGGNQQKLIVGREMSGDPVLLVASHPTRGVDIGAQAAIWDHIKAARRSGLAVLLISADLDELIGLSDRIEVILRGRLVGQFDPSQVTPQQLGSAMTGAAGTAETAGGTR